MATKTQDDVLRALLDTELIPEKDVFMKRFGVNFRIRAIDGRTINQMRELATYPTKGGGKQLDQEKFGALIIEKGCVVPDWTAPELLAKFGPTPADAIQKRLLAGEIAKLSNEILDLSGFDEDEAEAVEDVKN